MKHIFTITAFVLLIAGCGYAQTNKKAQTSQAAKSYPVKKTESEWKRILSPVAFEIMFKRGTETPYRNAYHDHKEKGVYVSAATGEPLFSSEDKFDSGTGWPSFTKPITSRAVAIIRDSSHGMVREEVVEAKTGLHLGHVFNDGPVSKGGKRYCMNSAALKFVKN